MTRGAMERYLVRREKIGPSVAAEDRSLHGEKGPSSKIMIMFKNKSKSEASPQGFEGGEVISTCAVTNTFELFDT